MAFRGSGAVTIDNPAFDDHASPCFQCSYCGIPKHRSGFSSHNLQSALGDCHERRQTPATAEGPWRGALVRCHLDGRGQLVSRQFNDWFISQGAPQAAPQDAQQGAVVILVPPEKWQQHFGEQPPVQGPHRGRCGRPRPGAHPPRGEGFHAVDASFKAASSPLLAGVAAPRRAWG
eukprot:TRINITY_DN2674_c0_g1_i2.p1 TRINITY_DN2674_c0_g1~~TRINITY_DN2674_c0_g1_i2.p1  ORF type:complete len:175 (+),score=20.46 TRINITY_DN2674_c0_g1_i2:96-620(+)